MMIGGSTSGTSRAPVDMIVFYHKSDLDGICSAAIARKALKAVNPTFHGLEYGDPFPWDRIKGADVVMLDFSLQPFSDMERLAREALSLTWIDHHKSAIEEAHKVQFTKTLMWNGRNNVFGIQKIERAACELCWSWFFPDTLTPKSVYLLGRYDIWKWQDVPDAIEFQYGMKRKRPDFDSPIWDELLAGGDVSAIVERGREIYREIKDQHAELIAKIGFEFEWNGLRVLACNRGPTSSQLFDSRFDPEKHDIMMPFYFNGSNWIVSIYSTKPEIDCSEIAKVSGGGGHKGAAGFTRKTLPDFLLGAAQQ